MSRPTPRRPASSRGAVNRPRKIAGQATAAPRDTDVIEIVPPEPRSDDEGPEQEPVLANPRLTRMLLIVLSVLTLVLVLQMVWFVRHEWFLDAPPEGSEATGAIPVPADRPVLENELAWKEGVDVAARAVEAMMSRSFETYDADVDKATGFMTDSFAEEFRATAGDVERSFLANKAVMSAEIRAQSVVRANDAELQALILFDQTTTTAGGDDPKTVLSAYRILMTMVHTDQGWFVDRLDTR